MRKQWKLADFILGGSKITADGDCSHEIKRCLLLGRKVMTNLDSILKSRDISLSIKVHLVRAIVFLVVMYECESWTIKKAERRRIDALELWCWRLLRVPRTARRSNQSILKEISPGSSLVGLMLKLKLQYFGHLMRRADSFEKTVMLGKKDWGQEEKGTTEDEMVGWHYQLNGHGFGWTQGVGVGDGQGGLECCGSWGCKESDSSDWTELRDEGGVIFFQSTLVAWGLVASYTILLLKEREVDVKKKKQQIYVTNTISFMLFFLNSDHSVSVPCGELFFI